MKISIDEQAGWDFDWFAVDIDGYLISFASGGGRLPEVVTASKENLQTLEHFFNSLPELSIDNEIILSIAPIGNMSSFLTYVRRGFYSFDKTVTQEFMDPFYGLVAAPPRARMLHDLPPAIITLIKPIYLPYSVIDLPIIDYRTIGQL